MQYIEQAVSFDCDGDQLLAVISQPAAPHETSSVGVVIVVGGPQYKVGSHRQFVLLARSLTASGHSCLRFDVRGMGDSLGSPRNFEEMGADIHAGVDALRQHCPKVREIVLLGLCDGASASLIYCHRYREAANIQGMCLINPWVRSVETQARTQIEHYYRERIFQRGFWLKFIQGNVGRVALRGIYDNLLAALGRQSPAPAGQGFQHEMALAWKAFSGPIMLALSGSDYTAKEFIACTKTNRFWHSALAQSNVSTFDLENADHTFSSATDQRLFEIQCSEWIDTHFIKIKAN